MPIPVGLAPVLKAMIYTFDSRQPVDIGSMFTEFEWSSFVNGGYNIRVKVTDTLYSRIHKIASEFYLEQAKSKPIPISFQLLWGNVKDAELSTPRFTAFITKIHCDGVPNTGSVEFIAVDPPSFVLRHGTAEGKVYHGNVSEVIKKVVRDATGAVFADAEVDPTTGAVPDINYIKLEISKTNDNENGLWYQMRMDPATFIMSMLEWSSSLTDSKSQWIVASGQKMHNGDGTDIAYPALFIKQWSDLEKGLNNNQKFLGTIAFNPATTGSNDVIDFEFLGDNLIGISQDMLVTQGISTTSGLFIDKNYKENNVEKAVVKDDNTPSKLNTDIIPHDGTSKSYKSPSDKAIVNRTNSIIAIPELNGGELGIKYQDYVDGRARNTYTKLLHASMRICVTVSGWYKIWDSTVLGSAVINLDWKNNDGSDYFLSGDWILYGFKHRISQGKWYTDLFLSRIDWDSSAIIVPNSRTTDAA